MRTQSGHVVRVFDPNRDPSVKEMLAQEQAKDPKVVAIKAHERYGLVATPKGTFALHSEGIGPRRPIDKMGMPVGFHRHFVDEPGRQSFECGAFATATYALADCEACLTGESLRLDEFVSAASFRNDRNFEAWEALLA
jgi:hypothetical protein